MDLAPHLIDLAAFFLDDEVESVQAYVRPLPNKSRIETDVLAMMQFRRGARMSMDISFVRKNLHNFMVTGTGGQIRAMGTMPWLTGGAMTGTLALARDFGGEELVAYPVHEHLEREMALFCQALEQGRELPVPGAAGLRAQAVIDAIYRSG